MPVLKRNLLYIKAFPFPADHLTLQQPALPHDSSLPVLFSADDDDRSHHKDRNQQKQQKPIHSPNFTELSFAQNYLVFGEKTSYSPIIIRRIPGLIPEYFLSKVHRKAEAQLCHPQVFGCRGKLGRVGNVKFDEDFFFTGREMLIGLVQMAERFPGAALYFSLTRFPDICSMEKTSISALGALRCISASIS